MVLLKYVIRKAELSDTDELSELFYEFIGTDSNKIVIKEQIEKINNTSNYFLAVACDGNKVIGTSMAILCYDFVGNCNPFLLVENVVVSPQYRSKGVGKLLMKAIEDFGAKNTCNYIILVSGNHRKQAHKFYESLGYSNENIGFKKRLLKQI